MPNNIDEHCLFENLNKKVAIFIVVQLLWSMYYDLCTRFKEPWNANFGISGGLVERF